MSASLAPPAWAPNRRPRANSICPACWRAAEANVALCVRDGRKRDLDNLVAMLKPVWDGLSGREREATDGTVDQSTAYFRPDHVAGDYVLCGGSGEDVAEQACTACRRRLADVLDPPLASVLRYPQQRPPALRSDDRYIEAIYHNCANLPLPDGRHDSPVPVQSWEKSRFSVQIHNTWESFCH